MPEVPIREKTQTPGRTHVTAETGVKVLQLQPRTAAKPPEAGRGQARPGRGPGRLQREHGPADTLTPGF